MFAILLAYRLIFFLVLKLKESASPLYRTVYAKVTVKKFMENASLKKKFVSTSKRHQPPHPMAVQEGLSSPLPY
jgi:hypothetical protein